MDVFIFLCTSFKMNNLLLWVGIAIIGLVLYVSPGFLIHRMYESFSPVAPVAPPATARAPPTAAVNTTGPATVTLTPSSPPPQQNAIQNLFEVLNTPPSLTSPTATQPAPARNSGTAIPLEYETTRSRPQDTRTVQQPSAALDQGDLYRTTRPRNPAPGPQGMIGSMGTQPRTPERVVYLEQEQEEIKPQNNAPLLNPNCPDMRDYIRKDSIPCWGCKLG